MMNARIARSEGTTVRSAMRQSTHVTARISFKGGLFRVPGEMQSTSDRKSLPLAANGSSQLETIANSQLCIC